MTHRRSVGVLLGSMRKASTSAALANASSMCHRWSYLVALQFLGTGDGACSGSGASGPESRQDRTDEQDVKSGLMIEFSYPLEITG